MATTSDLHVVETRPLVAPALLHQDLAPDASALNTVTSARKRIKAILRGDDQRLLAVVGPCSVHDVQAAREYAERLAPIRERLKDRLEVEIGRASCRERV